MRSWDNSGVRALVLALGISVGPGRGPFVQPFMVAAAAGHASASEASTSASMEALPAHCREPSHPTGRGAAGGRTVEPAFPPETLADLFRRASSMNGRWVDLTSLEWDSATTGWQRLADFGDPRKGRAFPHTPLRVNGQAFSSGIGTYPLSEISYSLGGGYGALRTQVGVDDSAPDHASVRFSIFADDVLLFRTTVLLKGEARRVELPLMGAREMRLMVDDAGDGSSGDYANWLDPEVFRLNTPPGVLAGESAPLLDAQRSAAPVRSSLGSLLDEDAVFSAAPSYLLGVVGSTTVWFAAERCLVVLENPRVRLAVGYGGTYHGRFSLFGPLGRRPTLEDATSEIALIQGGKVLVAETRTVPEHPWQIEELDKGGIGSGIQAQLHFRTAGGDPITLEFALFENADYSTYRLLVGGRIQPSGYSYMSGPSQIVVGDQARYLSDRSRVWRGRVPSDGIEREVPLEPGKPFLLWSRVTRQGVLLATIDQSEAPLRVSMVRGRGDRGTTVGLSLAYLPVELRSALVRSSPRILIQPVGVDHVFEALADYRWVIDRLYPGAPLPDWVGPQWDSWWAYGPTVTEEGVKRQVDYVFQNLWDLGTWNLIIDAAWYVAYGQPAADIRNVDYQKFPSGLRPVSEYAHQRNVRIILFMPAGFIHHGLDSGGEWLALRAIIDEHPDWLIPVLHGSSDSAYMLNYAHPEVRDYMRAVVGDFVNEHGVDGILLDGLADPEGQITDLRRRDLDSGMGAYLPATDILSLVAGRLRELRPDGYLESGWINPVFAHPLVHFFWWSDEWPSFDNEYPFGGLIQHIDYALFQRAALGQRAKLGTAWAAPGGPTVERWLEAGLAVGAPVALSFDLGSMDTAALSSLRARLAHRSVSQGRTVASSRERPNAFATTFNHISYVGLVNRTARPITLDEEVGEIGVVAPGLVAYDVERGVWLPAADLASVRLEPKTFRLFLIPHQPRIVWSNATWVYEPADDRLAAVLSGPPGLAGFAEIWAPGSTEVRLDGELLQRAGSAGPGRYTYDPRTGVVRVSLTFDQPRRLEARW